MPDKPTDAPPAQLAEFLRLLWQDAVGPRALLQTWTLATRRLEQWQAHQGPGAYLAGRADVYTGATLAARRVDHRHRPRATDAVAIAGMWADIDIKPGCARTLHEASAIARLHAEPTLVVHSGHGLQAWWLLQHPWTFRTQTDQQAAAILALRWGAAHAATALGRHGARLDCVHDLARLMRLPGTLNHKDPDQPVPVTLDAHRGPRYELAALQALVAHRTDTLATRPVGSARAPVAAIRAIAADAQLVARMHAAAQASPDLGTVLDGSLGRLCDWSQSEADLSLARRLAGARNPITGQAVFTDPEIAALVRAQRLAARPGDPKADRGDYLTRTVALARRSAHDHERTAA